jgi:UDP-N-acetylglucosamine:LPS N-acetylglucosamine transferase
MPDNKLCIFFSDTGGGHRSAAEAIEGGIARLVGDGIVANKPDVKLGLIAEKSHPVNRAFVEFYNYLLRHNQALMKYYYSFIQLLKPNDSEIGYRLSAPYVKHQLRKYNAKVVVSVHPMLNHYIGRAMRELGQKPHSKLIVVVTDPNSDLWRGWACTDADLTIVPNDLACERLVSWGIDRKKILTLGMPIHPDFLDPPTVSREEFLQALGLKPDRLTVCINAGWAGTKKMLRVLSSLSAVHRPVQIIFLAGHNQALFDEVQKFAAVSPIPTAVLPFHDRMADLMAACDLMVTKAGGLTTYEALARHLPLALDLLTEPMPQERGTAQIMIESKLAAPLYVPEDIIKIVDSIPEMQAQYRLPAIHSLDKTDAIYDICKTLVQAVDDVSLASRVPKIDAVE